MIRLEHVTFGYGLQKAVLRDVSLEIPQGGRLCLMGPSGKGKSTVLRLLLGLEKPRRGTVSVPEGTAFSAVFQENRLLPWKTALENVALFSDGETARRCLAALGRAAARHPARYPALCDLRRHHRCGLCLEVRHCRRGHLPHPGLSGGSFVER